MEVSKLLKPDRYTLAEEAASLLDDCMLKHHVQNIHHRQTITETALILHAFKQLVQTYSKTEDQQSAT